MSLLDVGVENLPNLYIQRIILSKRKVKVKCYLVDHSDKRSWRDREQMKNLKVKLLLLSDKRKMAYSSIFNGLSKGTDSLHNYKRSSATFNVRVEHASAFTPGEIQENKPSCDYFLKTFVFDRHQVQNLVLFGACFVDGFQFENNDFNKFYGPMTSEYVIQNNHIKKDSSYFYIPKTIKEYGGPVHYHKGKYMEGSHHRDTPHLSLIRIKEKNTKIIER